MHVVIWRNYVSKFKDIIREGNTYLIKNFVVVSNKSKYRIISSSSFMTSFFAATMVRLLDEVPHIITIPIFEFVKFSNLADRVRSDVPLI
ncbi:hypothetical protein COLO4_02881, partial [Corchorus olitorius]